MEEARELDRAARSLENREAQLRLITRNIQDMVMQVDVHSQIQYLSSSLHTILGYHLQDFRSAPQQVPELVHPDDQGKLPVPWKGLNHPPPVSRKSSDAKMRRVVTTGWNP